MWLRKRESHAHQGGLAPSSIQIILRRARHDNSPTNTPASVAAELVCKSFLLQLPQFTGQFIKLVDNLLVACFAVLPFQFSFIRFPISSSRVMVTAYHRVLRRSRAALTKCKTDPSYRSPQWGGSSDPAAGSLFDRRRRHHRIANTPYRMILHSRYIGSIY
jgi:hypothetical protein